MCGIEYGSGYSWQELVNLIHSEPRYDTAHIPPGFSDHRSNITNDFNGRAMKVLTAVLGENVEDYKEVNERRRPFSAGCTGFFRLNLFPVAFRDTSHSRWSGEFATSTGFSEKEAYLNFCQTERFKVLRQLAVERAPKLILCFGKTYTPDFVDAFADATCEMTEEVVEGVTLSWLINAAGTLVAICPFPNSRFNSNLKFQAMGDRIADLLKTITSR